MMRIAKESRVYWDKFFTFLTIFSLLLVVIAIILGGGFALISYIGVFLSPLGTIKGWAYIFKHDGILQVLFNIILILIPPLGLLASMIYSIFRPLDK